MPEEISETLPACRCGHNRHSKAVDREAEYSLVGWFLLSFGLTARPKRIKFRCRECGRLFDATTAPEWLARET
ncbi:MAG: hypothetical protein H7A21_01465 [Spirochaetales bacterium]|nr:hypothetical protein [Leptospiraceae bacterium]MCP5480076.1 hypothetical protein [Spirochaetales bacterium]MCP5485583.1 hypothetical protein [Spirochaetales bacterium]